MYGGCEFSRLVAKEVQSAGGHDHQEITFELQQKKSGHLILSRCFIPKLNTGCCVMALTGLNDSQHISCTSGVPKEKVYSLRRIVHWHKRHSRSSGANITIEWVARVCPPYLEALQVKDRRLYRPVVVGK